MTHPTATYPELIADLRARRLALGVTCVDLSEIAGYHPRAIRDWESRHIPSLARYLDWVAAIRELERRKSGAGG